MEYYLTAFITLISAVLGVAFSIEAVRKETDNRRPSALYMLERSLGLLSAAIIPVCLEAENITSTIYGLRPEALIRLTADEI